MIIFGIWNLGSVVRFCVLLVWEHRPLAHACRWCNSVIKAILCISGTVLVLCSERIQDQMSTYQKAGIRHPRGSNSLLVLSSGSLSQKRPCSGSSCDSAARNWMWDFIITWLISPQSFITLPDIVAAFTCETGDQRNKFDCTRHIQAADSDTSQQLIQYLFITVLRLLLSGFSLSYRSKIIVSISNATCEALAEQINEKRLQFAASAHLVGPDTHDTPLLCMS